MKRLSWLLPVVVLGCGSTSEGDALAPAQTVDLENPPQSALTALVRSLEVVDAVHAPDANIRVRAIECDLLIDRKKQREFVRVVLDVTVLAPSHDKAKRVFDELAKALATEGASSARPSAAAFGRVERVFQTMDWSASGVPTFAFHKLVSVSDSIRVEVQAGNADPSQPHADSAPFEGTQAVSEYIRQAAEDERAVIGSVETDVDIYHPRAGSSDVRYRIRPEDPHVPFSREQIGSFLYLLEAGSPATKVTHVKISPNEPGSDVAADQWTFQADVSIRVSEP